MKLYGVVKTIMMLFTLLALHVSITRITANSTIPSSYSWNNLRTDTVQISYSFNKKIWSGGTGYLHIKANGPGVYSDTKTATATVTVPDGSQAVVCVCGNDQRTLPGGWAVQEKYLRLYVDGKKVYELGREYWWAHCYTRAASIGPGTHTVKLTIHISVSVSSNTNEERDIAYAVMDIVVENSGSIQADSHRAQATLDGEATHVFGFRLPEASGETSISWKAVWKGIEKKGSGSPGSSQEASFTGSNKGSWVFSSPVVIRVGEPAPSVQPSEGYSIDAVYQEGSGVVGLKKVAVAINDGDEVGFTSGRYLVTTIEYAGLDSTGCTHVDNSNAWADSGSSVHWTQKIRFYSAEGWVVEDVAGGIETGVCVLKNVGGGTFSRKVGFSSKNRVDELTLTIQVPEIILHFDSMRAEPIGPTDLGTRRVGETVELKVKTSDCLEEYSRVDVYRVSESTPGVRSYTYSPVIGVYKGITSVTGGNVTFKVRWVSFKLVVSEVSGAVLRGGVYWAESGSKVGITISAYFSDDESPAAGVRIRDSEGREALTDSKGAAKFSYTGSDRESYFSYVAVDEHGNRLSNEVGVRIVFSRIVVEIVSCNSVLFKGTYYACNDAHVSIASRAFYSHNHAPVAGATVRFKPAGLLVTADSEGVAILKLTGGNKAYEGSIEFSDGLLEGSASLRIIFTNAILEASGNILQGMPMEEVEVTILARLTFNNMLLEGVKVKWVEGGIVRETPASFRLKIPENGFLKARFESVDFLPCVEPCEIILSSSTIKFGEPYEKNPRVFVNGFILEKYSYEFMLNIMDLLNLTIPRVVWYGNGSTAYGVKIGVVSSNGTVIRTSVVSDKGVSFNWTESKPGVYYYLVKPLGENVRGDVLSIKAVFTAFNITAEYIFDANETRILFAKARWAHNGSTVAGLPVHTLISKRRFLSDDRGIIRVFINDSDYKDSCIEKIVVLRSDAHPSGIWRMVGDCFVRIVKLGWSSPVITGDQYGFSITLNLTSYEYDIPMIIRVEGYSPELSSLIKILHVRSDNSSMTVFVKPTGSISFQDLLALRVEEADYDGVRVRVRVKSFSNRLVIKGVKIKLLNTTLEKIIGDIPPGFYSETVLELPEELRNNPIVLAACSENTIPHVVKVWRRQEISLLSFLSLMPLLVALVLRLRSRNRNSKKTSGNKAGKNMG